MGAMLQGLQSPQGCLLTLICCFMPPQAFRCPVLAAAALVVFALLPMAAATDATDAEVLLGFKAQFKNGNTVLSSWRGTEPCGSSWEGVGCRRGAVVSM